MRGDAGLSTHKPRHRLRGFRLLAAHRLVALALALG